MELFTIKTFHEVVDQIYYKVSDSSTLFVYFCRGMNNQVYHPRLTIWSLGRQAPEKLLAEVSGRSICSVVVHLLMLIKVKIVKCVHQIYVL